MRVGTLARLSEEAAANRRLQEEERLNVPLTTVSFKLSYARAQDVASLLKEIASPRARLIVDQRTNQLIISEIPAYLTTMQPSTRSTLRTVRWSSKRESSRQHRASCSGFNWASAELDPSVGTGTGLVFPSH